MRRARWNAWASRPAGCEVGEAHREGLEERVKGCEVGALDVPVGDLDLGVQVEPVELWVLSPDLLFQLNKF